MAPIHRVFEWDEKKAAINLRKHRIAFDDAIVVLSDPDGDRLHLNQVDSRHEETRVITLASDPDDRSVIYVLVWTDRSSKDAQITRLISARLANEREKKKYANRLDP